MRMIPIELIRRGDVWRDKGEGVHWWRFARDKFAL